MCTYTYRTFIGKFNKTTLEKKFEICKQSVGTVQFGLFQGRGDLRCARAAGMDSLRHCGHDVYDVVRRAAGTAHGLSEREKERVREERVRGMASCGGPESHLIADRDVLLRDEEYYQRKYGRDKRKNGYPVGQFLPRVGKAMAWMSSEDNRDFLSEIISAGRRAFKQKTVRSNEELIRRIDEYFAVVQGRRVPPTVEEFCLYLGMNTATVYDIMRGSQQGFPDYVANGDTGSILKKAMNVLHVADAVQAMKKMTDNTVYIFRSKNYYDMQDKTEQPIRITFETPEALPPEQIAKMIPDMTADRSMEDVTVI